MTEFTAAEFTALDERVNILSRNLDHMFLLVMGCCIFCEQEFFIEVTFYISVIHSSLLVSCYVQSFIVCLAVTTQITASKETRHIINSLKESLGRRLYKKSPGNTVQRDCRVNFLSKLSGKTEEFIKQNNPKQTANISVSYIFFLVSHCCGTDLQKISKISKYLDFDELYTI